MASNARPRSAATTTRYGCPWATSDAARIELECIRLGGTWTTSDGVTHGLGLAHHVRAFATIVWPWFIWQRWAVMLLEELCKPRHRLGCFGPSSAGKSSPTALAYLIFYFARPHNTTVLLSSTTRDELELRIWGEMKMLWREAKDQYDWLPGHLTDSKQMISTDDKATEGRDLRNGIIGRPMKVGNKWLVGSGASPFVGIKNDYVYVAADELGLCPGGILEALANLTVNPQCCFTGLGNLGDLDTPLGQILEPVNGWDSLPDSNVSRAYDTRWNNGRAVQFIGTDSPNLDYPEGAEPFPKIIGRRYLKQCSEDYGLDTPLYNMFAAGKIPRGTMENRVITDADVVRNNGYEPVVWGHEALTTLYCADISYLADHGDRTVGRPITFGKDAEGVMRLAFPERPLVYAPSDRATGSIEEQLAYLMMAECIRLSIPPSRVFWDGTGRSSFTAAFMRLPSWLGESPTAGHAIEFGGTASNRPNFLKRKYEEDLDARRKKGDLLPCDEVFDRFVSELWYAFYALVIAKQCRGIDRETVKEGEKRTWKLTAGNRISVEPKREMKLRVGRSPDAFDCVVTGLEGARRLGFPLGALALAARPSKAWISRLNRDYIAAHEAVALLSA